MNKKLLAIAVGAALAAASGMASANVDWYGKASIGLTDNDADGSELDLDGAGSRIGFNASEDLGNGVTVKYWHEWRLETADGPGFSGGPNAGQWGHRDNLLSFNGGFGTIGAGAIAAPSKVIGAGRLDMFGDTVGDANQRAVGGGARFFNQPAGSQLRYGNKFGDLSFTIAYGLDGSESNFTDAHVMYASGAIAAGLGYYTSGDAGDDGDAYDNGSIDADSMINLFLTYSMDNMKFLVGYEKASDIAVVGSGGDSKAYTLGASFGLGGGNTVLVQYSNKDADGDLGGTLTAIGFEHDFSKTTNIGVHYAINDPQDDAEDSVNAWDIGVNYKF